MAPRINDLLGKLEFSDDILKDCADGLESSGNAMPQFGNIQNALNAELKEETEEESILFLILEMMARYKGHNDKIVKTQAQVRRQQHQKKYKQRLTHFKNNEGSIVKIQAAFKGSNDRLAYKNKLQHFKSNERLFTKVLLY